MNKWEILEVSFFWKTPLPALFLYDLEKHTACLSRRIYCQKYLKQRQVFHKINLTAIGFLFKHCTNILLIYLESTYFLLNSEIIKENQGEIYGK